MLSTVVAVASVVVLLCFHRSGFGSFLFITVVGLEASFAVLLIVVALVCCFTMVSAQQNDGTSLVDKSCRCCCNLPFVCCGCALAFGVVAYE